ncbi:hypothetical protein [Paenibacillus sp. V4I7]|uniref:hypothetical protein n=1 Tax=Paenibacillus sp. V4I7 TaxID=3042307 RepID=UPI00277DF9BD|nr:hypothetical protein [Paenibacillus sp. V4I7]MDQ0902665.1 hypothetical protein [Paenibacillus sp. V4I7]
MYNVQHYPDKPVDAFYVLSGVTCFASILTSTLLKNDVIRVLDEALGTIGK